MCIHQAVELEWDQPKADANLSKHGVDFSDAETVLHDDGVMTIPDEESGEVRFVTTGMDALGRVMMVVHTWRAKRLRIISARSATPRKRRQYEAAR